MVCDLIGCNLLEFWLKIGGVVVAAAVILLLLLLYVGGSNDGSNNGSNDGSNDGVVGNIGFLDLSRLSRKL